MTFRRALLVAILLAAAAPTGRAAAQGFVAQPHYYLLTTEAVDGRALWVQPAGLAARREASISGMITADRGPDGTDVSQYGVGLASGGLGLGWQHDRLPDGSSGDVFAVGYGAGNPLVSLGATRRWFRGTNTSDAALDVGARYTPSPLLQMSLAWRNIGSPEIRDTVLEPTLTPGALLLLLGGRARIGADWEITTAGWNTSAVRAGATIALGNILALSARADLTGSLEYRGLAVSVTWNGAAARAVGFGNWPEASVDRYGAWLAAVRSLDQRRRRR